MANKDLETLASIQNVVLPVSAPRFIEIPPLKEIHGSFFVGVILSGVAALFFVLPVIGPGIDPLFRLQSLYYFSCFFYIVGILIPMSIPTKIELVGRSLNELGLKKKSISFGTGPNGEKTQRSKSQDGEGWICKPPKIKSWDLDNPYAEDEQGLLIEHPQNTGTPIPAMFTLRSIIRLLQSLFFVVMAVLIFNQSANLSAIYFVLFMGILSFIIRYREVRKWRSMSDLPTSTIRSVAVGAVEVFGQLRPLKAWPEAVLVNNDPDMAVQGMGAWSWSYAYLFEWEERVTETDQEGNVVGYRWESQSNSIHVCDDSGNWPTLLHDGTAGMALNPKLLTLEKGRLVKDWKISDPGLWSHVSPLSGDVRNMNAYHYLSIHGWSMGDPFFASCYAFPRPDKELDAEQVDRSIGTALLELTTTGNSRSHPISVHRGTEILALRDMESGISALAPSLSMVIISVLTLLAGM